MVFVSLNKLTNELVAVRADRIRILDEIKGIKLDNHQKIALMQGKAIDLEGMTSKIGKPFDATIQVNADHRGLEFKFNNTNQLDRQQNQGTTQE